MGALSRNVFVRAALIAVGVASSAASAAIVVGCQAAAKTTAETSSTQSSTANAKCYSAPHKFLTGADSSTVAIADFDGDRSPDLAVHDHEGASAVILKNDGRGGFTRSAELQTGKTPDWIAAGDLNGDLSPDLVTSNANGGTVSVLLNGGAGSFRPRTDYPAGQVPSFVLIGDVDGDGSSDLVVEDQVGPPYGLVLLNRGDGTFRPGPTLSIRQMGALADLNGDGKLDLVAREGRTVSVHLGRGDGTFAAGEPYGSINGPASVAVGDLNGDGAVDLVTGDDGVGPMGTGDTVSVLLNHGDGTFTGSHDFTAGEYPSSVAIEDVTGDAKADIVSADAYTQNVSVLVNDGKARFHERFVFPEQEKPGGAESAAAADLNNDGEPDLVLLSGAVTVLLNVPGPCRNAVAYFD